MKMAACMQGCVQSIASIHNMQFFRTVGIETLLSADASIFDFGDFLETFYS